MRIAFAADDENDTTRAVLDLIGRRGDEVVMIPGSAGASGPAPAEAGVSGTVAWPDLGAAVGRAVVGGAADFGIVMCWTGTGTAIAANKVPGVRAALAWEPWIAI
jgi:ribose 5-phosphate isomerase B